MYIFYYAILIILPTRSWSFSCQYNETSTVSRHAILLELEDDNYVKIYDASCDIRLINETANIELTSEKNLRFIESIQFRGYIVEGDVSEYIETELTTVVGYRYSKTRNVCKISYQETKSSSARNLTIGQETAILRLAQSCIQSKICGLDTKKIEKNGDLYFQSIQSSINGFVDANVPIVLDAFLQYGKIIRVPRITIRKGDISLYLDNGYITGADAVQRVSDVVINQEGSKIIVELKLRFPKMYLILNGIKAQYGTIAVSGDSIVNIEGASFKAKVFLDLREQSCLVGLSSVEEFAFKHVTFDTSLWGVRLFTYKFDSEKPYEFEKAILFDILRHIRFSFDCKKYIGKFGEILQ